MKTIALAILLSGQGADFASSVGRYETNPLLRGRDGRFSISKGLAVKGAVVGGLYLLGRKREMKKISPAIQTAVGATLGGQAVWNLKHQRSKHL